MLLSWHGQEHAHIHPNPRAIFIMLGVLILTVGYAIYTNSPIMAITFILVGLVGYLFLTQDPRTRDFTITTRGLVAGREFFSYESIDSYWFFETPPLENVLSLKSDGILSPYIHIPVPEELSQDVIKIVSTYLPEEHQDPRAVDILENFLHH